MIRITDRTLSCLDGVNAARADLLRLLELLIEAEPDAIELSQQMYERLAPLPAYSTYILYIDDVAEIAQYSDISHFVCRNAAPSTDSRIRSEILLNDIRETYTIARYADCKKIRVQGLDDSLLGNYRAAFENIRNSFNGEIEYCPGNHSHTATALASEWLTGGFGENIATSLGGIGGFAPTEELIIILKLRRLRKVGKEYPFFPELAQVMGRITGNPVRCNKPIIGDRIFHVESGVHVDGIIKQPKCYEPFPPEVVGRQRQVILGKMSGAASIRMKLKELGLECDAELVPTILEQVKTRSTETNNSLTDHEFTQIVRGCVT